MKKVSFIVLLLIGFVATATAQNNMYQSVIGVVNNASGGVEFINPTSCIAIDITVQKEQNIVGPYARYAQKYLDTRASLVEKTSYEVSKVSLSLVCDAQMFSSPAIAPQSVEVLSHNGSTTEFAKILPDRMSNTTQSLDASAMEAAQAIFDIRKHRMELITGEAGENVFGAGLKDALEALDKQENALLELFFGKNIITTSTERFYIAVEPDAKEYVVTHFSKAAGLNDNGDAVMLKITPSGKSRVTNITEADAKAKSFVEVTLADLANCEVTISDGKSPLCVKVLPIYEFGRTIRVAAPAAN